MQVFVTPQGRTTDELRLPGDGQSVAYEDAAQGGHTIAEVPCVLSRRDRDALLDARIDIVPRHGEPWIGTVSRITEPVNGVSSLICRGGQDALSRIVSPVIYAKTDFISAFQER